MANFRMLQPALKLPSAQMSGPTPFNQKPKRIVTLGACVACRKRKSKCDGSRPVCTCCEQKNSECIYELKPNEKPAQAVKRRNEELQSEAADLRQLFDILRLRPEHEALELFRRLRLNRSSTTTIEDIRELLDFVPEDSASPTQDSIGSSSSDTVPYRHIITLPPLRVALNSAGSHHKSSPFPIFSSTVDGYRDQWQRYLREDPSLLPDNTGPLGK